MFVIDFLLSRPIYFLAFRFTTYYFRLFPPFFLTFFLGFFLLTDHIYYRLIPAYLRRAEIWQVWFLALYLFYLSHSVVQFYNKDMLHERGDVTESWYYLFRITNLVYYYYQKTIVLNVFLAVSYHLNFTFSRGLCLRIPALPPPP